MAQYKVCTKCGENKPFTDYYKQKTGKYGLRPTCKQCIADYGKQYFKENRSECIRRTRDWAQRNPEKITAIHERYKKNNPEKHRNKWIKRRTVKQRLKYDFDPVTSKRIRKRFGRKCALTLSGNTHLDHFIPMSTGHGGTYEGNLILLDQDLNLSKSTSNPFIWAETLPSEQKEMFDKVVQYLAEINGLTIDEYREFVFWCFENPRGIEDITDENRDSLELWLRTKLIWREQK